MWYCQTSFLGQIGISIKCCVSLVPLPKDATYHSSGKPLKLRHPSFQGGFVVGGFVRSVCSFFSLFFIKIIFSLFQSLYKSHTHTWDPETMVCYNLYIQGVVLHPLDTLNKLGFFHLLIYVGNEALPQVTKSPGIIHQVTGPSHLALLSCHRVRSAEALARHGKYLKKQPSWWGSMGDFHIELNRTCVCIHTYIYIYIMCMIPMCIKVGGCISTYSYIGCIPRPITLEKGGL